MGLKLIREDNKKEISNNTLIPNNISVELFFTKEIVNLQKNARIEYAMVLTEPKYEKYNQYASTIDNDYCKENGIDNCNDEKNYFKKKSYIGRTSYCDIIINSEEFINECDEYCIICSKNNNLECLNCEYNYELSDNDKKKCIKINKIESTEIPSPISESIKEGFKTTNILSDIAYTSQEKANTPIEIINTQIEIANTPTEITNITTEITNIPTEITNIPTEITNIPTEITNIPTEITNIPTEITNTQIEITNTPTEITNIPTEITNLSTKLTILSSENTNFLKESNTVYISSEVKKSLELESISTEIKIMSSKVTSSSILLSQSLELSTDSSGLENKITGNHSHSTVIVNNLTNFVTDIHQESESSTLLKENCRYYFNSTKQEIIKEKIINKNYSQENIIIREENFIIQLSKYEDQYNYNIQDVSSIDLGECENKLKKSKNIPLSQPLIIFKTDIRITEFFTTYVLYEVYNPLTLEKLNLTACINDEISINIPAELNSNIKKLYNSLNESGYNLFNERDSFYDDLCTTYTSFNETDILLSDRKKDIYTEGQSQPICQKGCKLSSYDLNYHKARCDCSVSSEKEIKDINFQKLFEGNNIENTFYETITHSNFHVVKCYKLIFIFSRILKNIGEILMTFVFLIFITLIIIYCVKGKDYIMKNIKFVLKLQGFKSFGENQNSNLKRNKPNKKVSKFKKINTMNKGRFKTNIKKEKLKKSLSQQAPPKKPHIKSNKCHIKNTELTNNIINNNIMINFKVNTKYSSNNNIFSLKKKKL